MLSFDELQKKYKDQKPQTVAGPSTEDPLYIKYREAVEAEKPKVAGGTVNPIISFGNVRENPVLKRKTNTTKTYSQALTESRNKAKVLENGAKLPAVIPPKGDVSKLILPDTGGGGTVNPTLKRNEVRTKYDYMTDREAAVYKYYRDRGQVEKAQEYLDALEMDVNQRAAMEKREDAKKLAEESTAAALYARAVGNIGQAAGAVYAAAMEGADKPVDPYHPLMGGVNMNEGLAEGLMGDSTGVKKFAKEAGLAVFDWGTQAATLGPLTPYVMAAGAAAGNTKEALERGGTTDEAVMYGLAGGAAEAITEKLGYDRLFELGKITKNKGEVSTFLKSLLPQAASEGAEEATSEIANLLADTLIMGDNSQMKQIAQTAMESGATESEAVKTALMEGIKQVGYSGAVGAASGGVIAGGIGGLSRMTGRNTLEMAGNPVETARDAMTNAGKEVTKRTMKSRTRSEVPEGTQPETMLKEQGNVLPERENMLPEQGNVMGNSENTPMEQRQENKALRDFGEKYYYTEGQKVVNEEAERRGDTSFIPAFQTYYTAGLTGVKESDIKQTAETIVADKGLLRAAYLAGVNDRKADLEARMKGTGKMGQTAGVFLETDAVTKEQRSLAELVSRVAELEVVLVDELPQDRRGYYENNKGRVTIALNSGQFAGTLFHESIHYIREANPEGFDRLRQVVFSAAAAKQGIDLESYTQKYEKMYGEAYQEAGQKVDYDMILEEMTADAFAEVAGDEKTFRTFVKEMQNTNPSVLEKIKEFLENLLETLKGLVNDGRFSSFGEEIRKDIKETEKLAKMLAEEMKKAGDKQRGEKTEKKGEKKEKKYSFAGEKARTADREKLDMAKKMEEEGKTPERIYEETGWFRGLDQKWKFEIDDSAAEFFPEGDANLQNNPSYKKFREMMENGETDKPEFWSLWEIFEGEMGKEDKSLNFYLKHEKLFEQYPILQYVKIRIEDMRGKNREGYYDPAKNEIVLDGSLLNQYTKEKTKGILLHEIQHAIQKYEGFTQGSNTKVWEDVRTEIKEILAGAVRNRDLWLADIGYNDFVKKSMMQVAKKEKTMQEHWEDVKKFKENSEFAKQIEASEKEVKYYEKHLAMVSNLADGTWANANEMYWNTAGEMEARAVAERKDLTEKERRKEKVNLNREKAVFAENLNEMAKRYGVRFSLKEPVEETKDLIAVHNLTGEKLRKLLDLQGIPMPSIAITKSDATAEEFGEISLVFRKDAIDPADERNKVYDADAWTPMFPMLDKEEYGKTRAFLEELVRTMQAQTKSGKNAQGFMGENTMRAAMANRFVSLGEIKEAREKLEHLPKEEFEALREEMNQRLFGVLEEIYDTGSQTGINEVYEMEDIGEQIQNMTEEVKGVPSAQQIQQNLKKAGYPISMELAEQTARVLAEIKEMPTDFFEAKPERVVEFAEVAAAVVPDDLEVDLRKAVENKIPQVLEYEAGSKESRVRQLNRVEGVRFSIREEEYEDLVEKNEALQEANEALLRQFEITKDAVHDPVSAKKAVRKWLKSINSTYDADIFTEKFIALADYVANAGDQVDMQMVMGALQKLAYDALSESKVLNTDLSDAYKDFKNDVRKTKIKVTEDMAEEFDYYGGYNTVRKENFGKINLSRQGGIYADVFYQEMAEKYPELLDVERVSTQVDVVMDLLDVVDSLQPIYENPYGMNLDEYAMDAAYDLWEMYFDIELQKPTFADKYEKKLEKEKARARAARENLRKDLKERYDEKLQQAKEDQKKKLEDARLAAAMHEGRALVKQRRAIYEKLKARDKERRDRAEYAKYKNIIEKEAALLKRWVERPTDQYHVQESMMEGVRNFLEKMKFDDPDLNIMPTDIRRMIKDYQAMTAENTMLYAEEDENVQAMLESLADRVGDGVKVSELGPTEMRQLSVVIRSVSHLVRNANRMVSIKNGEKISTIGNAYMEDVENKKTKNPDSRLRVLSDMMNVQMLDTESFFREMGKTVHDTIYRGLREGFDRKILHVKEASEFMQKTVDKKKIREWGEMEPKEYTLSGGKILLTDAQIMSLYCLMRRTQARGHIFGGGIKGEPVVHKVRGQRKIVKNTEPVEVTAADVTKLMSNLTEEQKKAALEIQGYLESVASWGNEVTMNMLGYKKFTETNYFPIVTDENYINTMYGARGEKNSTLQTMGITKQTNREAKNPIILENIFDAYVRHIDQMSSYNAFVPALSDLNKFMNYREMVRVVDGKKFGENRSVKETMQRVMGPTGDKYVRDLMERLNNPAVKEDVERLPRIFLRNMKIASVGANLRVIIQQPVSYLRAADEIGVGYLMGALVPSKTDFEKVYEYAPIAQWKEWGNYEMNVGRTMKELLVGQNFYESFLEKSMIAAGVMDKLTWGRIWRAAELEVKKKHPELTGNRYYETVGKRFSEIIDGTQVVDSILHRNQMMRSQSLFSQMATSFMSEPTKTYNMMRNSMVAVIKENTPENRKKVVRTFMTLVANGVCVAAAAGLVDMLRDDDDDETLLEKWLQAFRGDFSEAESVSDYILAAIGSNLGNSFNPLGYIPYMRDIFSVIQGYTVQRTDISWLNDLVKSGKNLMRYMSGESNYTLNAVLMDAAGSLSKATGIPINSAKRDILAIKNTIVNYTLGLDAQYENQKLTYDVGSEKNINMYVKMMLEAKMSGNEQIATRIYNDMVNGGISNEKIDNKIKTEQVKAIKEEPEAMEAAKAYNEGRVDDYTRNVEALAKKGYFMENIESAMESLTKPPKEDEETFETITKDYWKEEGEVESADYALLFNAYMNGNMADYDKMWAILNAAGKEDNSIRSSMRSRLKSEYWKAKEAGDSQRMQRAANEFYRLGGKRETLEKPPQ